MASEESDVASERVMKSSFFVFVVIVCIFQFFNSYASASYAAGVVSYDSGTGAVPDYNNPMAALGRGPKDTGEFMGTVYYVTPFNAPYSADDVVSIGLGGHITLQLANYALPLEDSPEIGVFTYQQFAQDNWPVGGTHDPVILFRASQKTIVEVSEYGLSWMALNNGESMTFDIPPNAYQDVAGTIEADYGMPFTGVLSDFDNKLTVQDTIDVYSGSAGGTWFDISATGLDKVGYVRFSVAGDAANSFELEELSIANNALGLPVPEPSTIALVLLGGLIMSRKNKR